jgi:hypothetical protein
MALARRAALPRKVTPVMPSDNSNGPKPAQSLGDGGAAHAPAGGPAPARPRQRLFHDASVFLLMLAAGSAAVAVDLSLYSTLESKLHLCLPR